MWQVRSGLQVLQACISTEALEDFSLCLHKIWPCDLEEVTKAAIPKSDAQLALGTLAGIAEFAVRLTQHENDGHPLAPLFHSNHRMPLSAPPSPGATPPACSVHAWFVRWACQHKHNGHGDLHPCLQHDPSQCRIRSLERNNATSNSCCCSSSFQSILYHPYWSPAIRDSTAVRLSHAAWQSEIHLTIVFYFFA